MENEGILIIDKPVGLTSRAIDNRIGHLFSSRHVGHLGTLDPFASGMLIIGVNKGNKALTYIDDSKKTYRATLVLGKKTDSGDLTGNIIEEKEIGTCAAFSRREDGYQYVILSHSADLRPVGKALNTAFSGRGGGPAEMIQGALTGNEADIRAFLEEQF